MFKRIALLLLILLLPVFAVAGFYGYLWSSVRSSADELIAKVAPFAELRYGNVHIDLLATEVGLKNITLIPMGSSDQLMLGEWVVKTSDWSEMLQLQERLEGKMPSSLTMRVNGLLFDLNSSLAKQWQMAFEQARDPSIPMPGAFCGDAAGVELLRELGYRSLSSDTLLSFSYDPAAAEAVIYLDSDTAQVGAMTTEVKLQVRGESVSMPATMMGGVELKSLRVTYRDSGYNRRYLGYCKQSAGIDDAQFEVIFRQEIDDLLVLTGVQLTDAQIAGLVALNKPDAELALNIQPLVPLGAANPPEIASVDAALNFLNPSLIISGQSIPLQGISWKPPEKKQTLTIEEQVEQAVALSRERAKAQADQLAQLSKPDAVPALPRVSEFQEITASEAAKYKGGKARLITYFGREISGRIIDANAQEIVIEQRLEMGVATYAIALDKVSEIEVYR